MTPPPPPALRAALVRDVMATVAEAAEQRPSAWPIIQRRIWAEDALAEPEAAYLIWYEDAGIAVFSDGLSGGFRRSLHELAELLFAIDAAKPNDYMRRNIEAYEAELASIALRFQVPTSRLRSLATVRVPT